MLFQLLLLYNIHPKLGAIKQSPFKKKKNNHHFIGHIDFVAYEFSEGTVGAALFCCILFQASTGDLTARSSSFTWLSLVWKGWRLGSAGTIKQSAYAHGLSIWLGFSLHGVWVLWDCKPRGSVPRDSIRRELGGKNMAFPSLQTSLLLYATS